MSTFTFQSTIQHQGVLIHITLHVHHRHYKKMTQCHLNQDPKLGTIRIVAVNHEDVELDFSSLPIEEQIRLRRESWDYVRNKGG